MPTAGNKTGKRSSLKEKPRGGSHGCKSMDDSVQEKFKRNALTKNPSYRRLGEQKKNRSKGAEEGALLGSPPSDLPSVGANREKTGVRGEKSHGRKGGCIIQIANLVSRGAISRGHS